MNYDWDDKTKELVKEVSKIVDECKDSVKNISGKELILDFQKQLAKVGYWKMVSELSPGKTSMTLTACDLELTKLDASLMLSINATRRFAELVFSFAPDSVKEKLSEPLLNGEIIGAVAYREPGDKLDSINTNTTKTENTYKAFAYKQFVTNAAFADWILVLCSVDGEYVGFPLEAKMEGMSISDGQKLIGLDGLSVATLTLDGVEVDSGCTLFGSKSFTLEKVFLQQNNLGASIAATGLMHRAFAATKEYATSHIKNGKPIIKHQEIRYKMAELLTMMQTSELFVARCAWMSETDDFDLAATVLAAKTFITESAEKVASECMQVMAGEGYIAGNDVEKAFRDSKGLALIGTSSEMARVQIADDLLSRY